MPNLMLLHMKQQMDHGIFSRDPGTNKVDKPGWRVQKLQKLADEAWERGGKIGRQMKISATHLGTLFPVDWATARGMMDWNNNVLEACVFGVGGTDAVLAALDGDDYDTAIRGCGKTGLDTSRLSKDLKETQAVNDEFARQVLEFSNVVKKAAKRGEAVPFDIQFWKATTDAETGSALDPVIYHVNDGVDVALECMKSDEVWPKVLLESQLFKALEAGPRLLLKART